MKNEDKKEFVTIMTAMGENFNAEISREGMRIRFDAMSDLSIEQVRAACTELVKTRIYPGMPTTGEIRAAIPGKAVCIEDTAQLRVNEIMGKIRSLGSYGSPTWNDPVVEKLLSSRWSWQTLCAMTETEHKWWAKEFVEAYRALAESRTQPQQIEDYDAVRQLVSGIGFEVKS